MQASSRPLPQSPNHEAQVCTERPYFMLMCSPYMSKGSCASSRTRTNKRHHDNGLHETAARSAFPPRSRSRTPKRVAQHQPQDHDAPEPRDKIQDAVDQVQAHRLWRVYRAAGNIGAMAMKTGAVELAAAWTRAGVLCDGNSWRRRRAAECQPAALYQRPFAVMFLSTTARGSDRKHIRSSMSGRSQIRQLDLARSSSIPSIFRHLRWFPQTVQLLKIQQLITIYA